jgi:PAS domain S-box-containing protein
LRANGLSGVYWRYGIAVCSVLAGVALRFLLASVLGQSVPYITMFPGVMFAAWLGGLGPGLLATGLSLFAALWLFIPPLGRLGPMTWETATGAVLFGLVSVFIVALNEALRSSRARSDQRLLELQEQTARRISTEEKLTISRRDAERDRDLLLTTISSIGDAVIATDSQGNVTFLNPVAQELTGWNPTEAAGRPITDVFVIRHEKTRMAAENPVGKVIQEGIVVNLANHTVLIAKDGREIAIEDSAAPIRGKDGRLLGVVLVFRDVTGRRRSEDAMTRSEERLTLAMDVGRIGVWDWDVAGNRVEWSDRVHDIHGVEQGKFSGGVDEFAQLVYHEDRTRIGEAIEAALQHDAPYDVEFRVTYPNGTIHWVATTARVFRNEKGAPIRMVGATTDITERKQAESLLLQQWHSFDTALSNTPDFTYLFDLDGRFTYINRALLSLWQKTLAEAVGKNFFELEYPEELAGRLQRQIREVIETGQPVRDQTPFTGPTGETRYYEYIFVPVLSAAGMVEAVAGSTRDVSDRRAAEESLRASEERMSFALEAGGGVGTWDLSVPAGRILVDSQFARLHSVSSDRVATGISVTDFLDLIHVEDRERVRQNIQTAIETCGEYAVEYRLVRDGALRWIYARGRCHRDQEGCRFPGVVLDITERKRAEEALRQSQARLRAIYDGTFGYIGLLAPDGTLLEANRASLEFANNTREDVIGKLFWDTPWFTATPGAPAAVRAAFLRAATGEYVRFEAALHRPSGEVPTFDISFHPIRNERDEVVLIVPEGHDVTERVQAEADLRRSNDELKRANRELEEFSYVASHDLREPLRMVNIYAQLILERIAAKNGDEGDATLSQFANFVRQGANRMEALIDDLLTFAVSVHAESVPAGAADLSESFRQALSVLSSRIVESGATITADPLPEVIGDVQQMAHVFQNLLSNSLKYSRVGVPPEIHVSVQTDGDICTISIRDNGIGFDQGYAERIFGLFKRLHKEEYPGTGLGLAICKRIVERYRGSIWAEGRPASGATFYFALPLADAGARSAISQSAAS